MQFELGLTREGLKDLRNQLAQVPRACFSPEEPLRQYSDVIDGLVRKAFHKAQSSASPPPVCLVAVGGYGRGELAPYSDIDLLLLHLPSDKANLAPLVEKTLYPLWDLGLDVSCSSRSVMECLNMAQSDLHVKTGLMDARYLDGNYDFFRELHGAMIKRILHRKVREFGEALMKDLCDRHRKYEDPAYVLEPTLKEGPGGLRDFQSGRWMIRSRFKTDRWDSILFPDQARSLEKGVEFLWALRNQLHLISGRRQDDFTFELQEKIAPVLGFSEGTKGIEEMMRQYHLSTQRVQNFAVGTLERALSEPSLLRKTLFFIQRRKINEHFGIRNGKLSLLDPVTFKREPAQVMTLFKHCQTHRLEIDDRTEEAVTEALPFIDDRFQTSDSVNRTFLSILGHGERVERLLKKMHALGVLSRYIPEFSEIERRVHYDLYHVHPVDVHSILAVAELIRLKDGIYQEHHPLLTSLIREIENLDILLLASLLHDVGKGVGGDHSLVGAELAKGIAGRMGLGGEDIKRIEFLIRNHLFMLETAFRRDLRDEQVIFRFANRIETLDQLNMLYLLTFADIKAVGPEAWTSWKDSLLSELFLKTSLFFEKDRGLGPIPKEEEVATKLAERLAPAIVNEYVDHLPANYLSSHSWEEIAHHIGMAQRLDQSPVAVEWETEGQIRAKVTLCTKDRYGLFSKIAGSMFVNRLNILNAQIHTWANGIVIDLFDVEDATSEIDRRLTQFEKDFQEILDGRVSLKTLIAKRKESTWTERKVIPGVAVEVKINNQDSGFYTIVEISGEDRMGILYEITQALTDHGCDIHFARVSTLGNRIVDVFYLQDTWGEKIEGKERIQSLRDTLLRPLTSRDQ